MTFRFTTAGESHGRGLVGILEGIPAGLPLSAADVDTELKRRQGGYGRGARMKIESDRIEWLAGVRAGETLGSPIAMLIWNRDWEHWQDVMAPEADDPKGERRRQVTRPRPGHADLAGSLKYDRSDARDILERASARETVARVACGAVCKKLLGEFDIEIGSHVVELGGVTAKSCSVLPAPINERADQSPVRCLDQEAEQEMIRRIDAAKAAGDTLGGIVEVIALGVPVGLGSHVSWDTKLDGRLAQALMSIPAVKGVELGLGFEAARRKGSEVHDEILPGFSRATNRAGGTEGGMTTGEPLVVRAAMKPISTLMSPLKTVDLRTGGPAQAQSERSDVTAVPAMGVIAEAMTAIVVTEALLEKFGGDALSELKRNVDGYLAHVRARTPKGAAS
ncbi:MAG: chorismate synthase [Gemmatimonadetes bacterium 13_1_40CM_3_65_8]|nr:MAG: chorismate synthase [Gemmatimonadetes bacterium 13_1_40CM_4_65_7]OLD04244.1 MAG: chorismate synthase [Gemmatimonadetes bacterium 13_1_40CM_3_65_8]